MIDMDPETAEWFLGRGYNLGRLVAPLDWTPRDHSSCDELEVIREVAAINGAPGEPDWGENLRYVAREVLLVGAPKGGAGMVSNHEWDDRQFRVLTPTFDGGDDLEWVERFAEMDDESALDPEAAEGYSAAEAILAALALHQDVCAYTIHCTAVEYRDHLFALVNDTEAVEAFERQRCGDFQGPVLTEDEQDAERARRYRLAIVEW